MFRVKFHQHHNLVLDGIKEVVAMYEGKNILVAKPRKQNKTPGIYIAFLLNAGLRAVADKRV